MITSQPPPRQDNALTQPVGRLAAPVEPLHAWNSLEIAARELQESGLPALPVVKEGIYAGLLTEQDIARALAVGLPPTAAVQELLLAPPPALKGYESGAQALRYFTDHQCPALAVTDELGRVTGLLLPSRLLVTNNHEIRPKMVGGMATPLGVYLSTGSVTGGVPQWALVLTGATMLGIFLVGTTATLLLLNLLPPAVANLPVVSGGLEFLGILVFMVLLRNLPIAGYHGAEHMVVHAIEQGEPLTPEVVRRMPRVHPRCGTNFAVAAMLFLGVWSIPFIEEEALRLLLAFLVTLVFFRPLGSAAQYYLTTKTPTEKQLLAGIQAGKHLLQNYQTASNTVASPLKRLFNSGLFHIMAGSILATLVLLAVMAVLNVPEEWRVLLIG